MADEEGKAEVTTISERSAGRRVVRGREPLAEPEPFGLEWLLHHVEPVDFFGEHWETAPLLVARDDPEYFVDLPGFDRIEELITATTSGPMRSANDGRIVRTEPSGDLADRAIALDANGMPDIQDVYRAYHQGFTIVVNQVQRRSAAYALLCRALEASLHHPVGTNLYLTPRRGQGFRPHVDTHDVFILQLHGEKEWHVASPRTDLPLASAHYDWIESLSEFRTFTLRPGDTFYLPRGFPHEATTGSSSSLHATVGVNAYRWVDLLGEMLPLIADEHRELRTALPPGFLDVSLDPARTARLAEHLALALGDRSLVDRAKARLGSRLVNAGKAAGRGQFRSIDAVEDVTADSAVARAPGLLCRVRATSEEARIEFATNYVSGPAALEPALRFIAERERFVVRDLPGPFTIEDKIDLVTRLVSEGLLICIDDRKEDAGDGYQ
jgi:lysine-specific demethylase/histidyl-hydroxylase NO66